jgi:hypothetical protein
MRLVCLVCLAATALACTACVTGVQQHAAFGSAPIKPAEIEAHVGDLVGFAIEPPVMGGSRWMLECHGRARFKGDPTASALEWTATPQPIWMETVVSPWDPEPGKAPRRSRGWLWFGQIELGENEALDRDLPVHRLPYRNVAPVTFSSTFSPVQRPERLHAVLHEGRVYVTYATPIDYGIPRAPSVDAMLVESDGKRVLYAEVSTNFGEIPRDRIAYDVTLSYAANVPPPVEVVVVGWIGHGTYYGSFTVDRMNIDGTTLGSG